MLVCQRKQERSAPTRVSVPGMNNSNECNGNHVLLVILFSLACLQSPSPNRSRKTAPNMGATRFSLLPYLCTVPSQKWGEICQSKNTYRSTAACFIFQSSVALHVSRGIPCSLCARMCVCVFVCVFWTRPEATLIGAAV